MTLCAGLTHGHGIAGEFINDEIFTVENRLAKSPDRPKQIDEAISELDLIVALE